MTKIQTRIRFWKKACYKRFSANLNGLVHHKQAEHSWFQEISRQKVTFCQEALKEKGWKSRSEPRTFSTKLLSTKECVCVRAHACAKIYFKTVDEKTSLKDLRATKDNRPLVKHEISHTLDETSYPFEPQQHTDAKI